MDSCAFDTLFAKSVPHILEKIFFSLDYASFKNCLEVNNRAWNELLATKQYRTRVKLVFHDELKKDHEELWNASRNGKYDEVRLVDVFGLKTPRKFKEFVISEPMSNKDDEKVKVCFPRPSQSMF